MDATVVNKIVYTLLVVLLAPIWLLILLLMVAWTIAALAAGALAEVLKD